MPGRRWSSRSPRRWSGASRTDPRTGVARAALPSLLLALLLGLAGCGGEDEQHQSLLGDAGGAGVTARQAITAEQHVLDQRARAVRQHKPRLFLRSVDHDDAKLMARQRRYYRNLVQLPLARFAYHVTDQQFEGQKIAQSWGEDVFIPQVRLTTQLEGFDAVPVERLVGFVFSLHGGTARIVSDRTATGKPLVRGPQAPWDLAAITVREQPGVLGIFDRRTRSSATTVMAVVRRGIDQLDRALPFDWSDHVVVYSVKDPAVLASFRDVPGGSIEHLGAMTFPTYAESGRSQVASTRMLLMPSSVAAGQPFLGRITRHELSHVAIGVRDDGAPAWVSEGIAEYLGAREVPQRDRIIPTSALERARTAVSAMPASRTFNGSDQEWNYALSWMACDYIAESSGESRLWELMEAMHNGGQGTADADQDRVLRQVLGYDSRELALRAAARIRNLYG